MKTIDQGKVQVFMDAAEEQMSQMGFSQNRKRVALQKGGMKSAFEKLCNENLSDIERAHAFMSVEIGLDEIAAIPEEDIDRIVWSWNGGKAVENLPSRLKELGAAECKKRGIKMLPSTGNKVHVAKSRVREWLECQQIALDKYINETEKSGVKSLREFREWLSSNLTKDEIRMITERFYYADKLYRSFYDYKRYACCQAYIHEFRSQLASFNVRAGDGK